MPADSDVPLPRTWRPLGVRLAGIFFSGALVLVTAMAWLGFDQEVRDRFTFMQKATVVLMWFLLVMVAYGLGRCRVVAHREGLTVVNFFRRRDYSWAQVIAVRMPRGAPWATLDVSDGTSVPVMAIQSADGPRATRAVRELRSVIDR